MSNITDSLVIPDLMRFHLENPADEVLRSALLDALLGCGRIKEHAKVLSEWEPRAWLKAKGREPWNYEANGLKNLDKSWWFAAGSEVIRDRVYAHWVTVYLASNMNSHYMSREEAIVALCKKWNTLEQLTKDYLWNWNPPS